MDVLVVCTVLSTINLIALNSTSLLKKLPVEYKVNIKACAEKIMAIQIVPYSLPNVFAG